MSAGKTKPTISVAPATTITVETLRAFAAMRPDPKPELRAPWSRGDFSMACDGVVMIRTNRFASVAENPNAPDVNGYLKFMFPSPKKNGWRPLPPLPAFNPKAPLAGMLIGVGRFQIRYLHLLATLPAVEVRPPKEEYTPLPFRCAGGAIGMLMMLKPDGEAQP